jgi:hypothetical protein
VVTFLAIALVECAEFLGQTGDRVGSPPNEAPPAAGWPLPLIDDALRWDPAPDDPDLLDRRPFHLWWDTLPGTPFRGDLQTDRPTATFEDSTDLRARQHMTKLGIGMPLTRAMGTLSVDMQVHGGAALPDPWDVRHDSLMPFERGSARVGIRWQDRRRDELEASIGSRYNVAAAREGPDDVAVSIKAMLPGPLKSWYVQGKASADSEHAQQAGLFLGMAQAVGSGSRLTSSIGLTRREYRTRLEQYHTSTIMNWTIQWSWNDRLSFGTTVSYYPDLREMESLMSLELKSRVPPP